MICQFADEQRILGKSGKRAFVRLILRGGGLPLELPIIAARGVGMRAIAKVVEDPPDPKAATENWTNKMHCGGSDLGGEQTQRPEHKGMAAASRITPVQKSLYGTVVECRPS